MAVGDVVCELELPSSVVSEEQVALAPVYHWYEYGAVPPDGLAAKLIVSPLSMLGLKGEIGPAINPEPTVTVFGGEHRDGIGVPCDESETL